MLKSSKLFFFSFLFLVLTFSFISAELYSEEDLYGMPTTDIHVLNTGDDLTGNYTFNGLCIDGGVEIRPDGTICAQALHVYNITSVDVTKQNVTVLENLISLQNITANHFIGDGSFLTGIFSEAEGNNTWLTLSGDNANQNINISSYNFSASWGLFDFLGSVMDNIVNIFVTDMNVSNDLIVGGDIENYGTGSFVNSTFLIDGDLSRGDATLVIEADINDNACINMSEGSGTLGIQICYDGAGINRGFVVSNRATRYEYFWIDRDTGLINLNNNTVINGNIISDNVFIPQYIFSHTNATIPVLGIGVWTNITFAQEDTDVKFGIEHTYNDNTNNTFTITEDGVYDVDYNMDVEDTSPSSSDIDVAGRAIFINGTEILGSVFELDIIKKGIEVELSHNFLVRLVAGDKIIIQFTASNVNVQMSTHGVYGDHPESGSVVIEKVANL